MRRAPRADAAVGEVGSVVRLWLNRTLPEVFRAHLPHRPLRILDVGCGAGAVAAQLVQAGASGTYVGIDLAARPEWVPARDGDLAVEFVELDARHLDALPGRFDAAVAIMSFEHLADDRAVLREVAQRLSIGGVVVLAVPSPASRWYLGRRHSYRWYRRPDLEALARDAALELVSVSTRCSSVGLVVDGLRYALFTGAARAVRAAVYLRHGGNRRRALATSPWAGDVNTWLNSGWVSLAGGRVARSVAAAAARLDGTLPGVEVAHVAVLRKPHDA